MRWSAYGKTGTKNALPSHTQGGSRMPELGPYGSVRGALSNERPYRDLRNVVAKYPFERSHRFPLTEPNSGRRDYSRSSCGVADMQLGRKPGISAGMLRVRRQPELARISRLRAEFRPWRPRV